MNKQSTAISENRDIGQTGRLYYLDWLRVVAILVVFCFHSAKIFDYHTTDVFNAVRSPVLSAFREFNFCLVRQNLPAAQCFVISSAAIDTDAHIALIVG